MIDSNSGGRTTEVVKRTQQIGEHPTKLFASTFLSDYYDGLMQDCKIIFIDKTDSLDPTRWEFFWMRVLKTIASLSLNVGEGYSY